MAKSPVSFAVDAPNSFHQAPATTGLNTVDRNPGSIRPDESNLAERSTFSGRESSIPVADLRVTIAAGQPAGYVDVLRGPVERTYKPVDGSNEWIGLSSAWDEGSAPEGPDYGRSDIGLGSQPASVAKGDRVDLSFAKAGNGNL